MKQKATEEGRQDISADMIYGKSITDPCIDGKIQKS